MHLKIIFFFITLNYLIAEQEIYQHVKINLHNTDQLQELYELGIPLDHYQRNKDNTLDIVLSTSEKNILVPVSYTHLTLPTILLV